MKTKQNSILGDGTLHFRTAFQTALGEISRSTQIRYENSGLIPKPDGYIGRRPVWLGSTIRETVAKFIAEGESRRPACDVPLSPGRPRKEKTTSVVSNAMDKTVLKIDGMED